MPYNSETETFYQAPATVVDSTPDGDTVQEGFDDRLTPAMAGVYTDLNLLKENGMISVGIPATTTARGIGRVATSADLVDGTTITNGPAFIAAGVNTSVAAAAGKVPISDSNGKLDAWVNIPASLQFASSSTAGATAAKTATCSNFALTNGARVCVVFANENTVAGALTLEINGTGAKSIFDEFGQAVSATNPAYFKKGCKIEFYYDGTNWVFINRVSKQYVTGKTGYRVWANGFIEQRGQTPWAVVANGTITFPIAFKDTNYSLNWSFATTVAFFSGSASYDWITAYNMTTVGFSFYANSANTSGELNRHYYARGF